MNIQQINYTNLANEICKFLQTQNDDALIALSGGSTIPPVIEELNKQNLSNSLRFTWIDERLVPYDADGSNYGIMKNDLQNYICHPLPCDNDEKKALLYQEALSDEKGIVKSDLLLLGFGDDGHIASLFPNSKELDLPCKENEWIFRSQASYKPKERWTWGMDAICRSKKCFIIFKGDETSDKYKRLDEALNSEECTSPLKRFIKESKAEITIFQII